MARRQELYVTIVGGNFRGKGAEAMLLTVQDAIRQGLPDAVCCGLPLSQAERKRFRDHGFCTVTSYRPGRAREIINFVLESLRIMPRTPVDPQSIGEGGICNVFRAGDVIVDISGFKSSDQVGPKHALARWFRYRQARYAGSRFIYMPQSWGPFENRAVRFLTRSMLKDAIIVFAREQYSHDYLADRAVVDMSKVLLCPDIAFKFRAADVESGKRVLAEAGIADQSGGVIAMTPNMRIYERTGGVGTENIYVSLLLSIMNYFLQNTTCRILLIPHENSFWGPNDPELCRMLVEQVNRSDRVHTVTGEESAAEIKAVIGLVDFLVASRYHSLIAAMSMRTPAAVIGWSHKYDYVMDQVGLSEWVVDPVRRSERGTKDIIVEAWKSRDAIRRALEENMRQLEERSQMSLDRMIEAIRSMRSY